MRLIKLFKKYWPYGLIILISFLAYHKTWVNGFLYWDDYFQIISNPLVKNLNLENLAKIFIPAQNPLGMYQPLASLSLALEYKLFGQTASLFHLFNLLWHIACSLSVYIFIKKLTERPKVALLVSLIFAVNPINGEAVYWISARSTLLASLFGLWSLINYFTYTKKEEVKYLYLSYLFFCLSLLSKASAIVLPITFLMIDWLNNKKFNKKLISDKLPAFSLSLVFGWLALAIRQDSHLAVANSSVYSFLDKIVLFFYSLGNHLVKIFVPLNLANFYDYPEKIGWAFSTSVWLYALLGVGLFIYGYKIRTKRLDFFLLSFFVITLLPMIKLVQSSTPIIADRYVYLAQLGPLTLVIIYFQKIKYLNRQIKLAIIVCLLAILGLTNVLLAVNWNNDVNLYERIIQVNPKCSKAYGLLGDTYIKLAKLDLAEEAYLSAVKYNPDDKTLWNNLGLIYERLQKWPEALAVLEKASAGEQTNPIVFRLKGLALANLNQTTEAIKNFNLAIVLEPDNGENYFYRGLALANANKLDEACKNLLKASDLSYNVSKELKEKICQ